MSGGDELSTEVYVVDSVAPALATENNATRKSSAVLQPVFPPPCVVPKKESQVVFHASAPLVLRPVSNLKMGHGASCLGIL
jgi:hypothetical protein